MNFAHPLAFAWLLLAIPIIALYLRRATIRREPTAMAMFWEQVLGQERESFLRRHQQGLSLAVQLAILAMLVTALAEPRLSPPQHVALIVDNSGDWAGAKQTARGLLEGMHGDDRVSVFSIAPITAHCGPTSDRTAALQAIDAIRSGGTRAAVDDLAAVLSTLSESDRNRFSKEVVVSSGAWAEANPSLKVVAPEEKNLAAESAKLFGPPRRALGWLFAALAAVGLAVEWLLYHRHRLV